MARQLVFSEDPAILDDAEPDDGADGAVDQRRRPRANTRGNTTGQDLNRDHALIEQNETKGFAAMLRDYTPDVMLDNHEGDSEDLPILGARHLNVYEPLFEEGKLMVNEWMYGAAAQSGWWMGPYSTGGDSHEGILRNTGGAQERRQHARRGARRGRRHAARRGDGQQPARQPAAQGLRAPVGELGGACGTSTAA